MADVKGVEATYIDFTRKTAKYPKRREKEYLMIGLMNEAGEDLMLNTIDKLFQRMPPEEAKVWRAENGGY